jgi:hypothetical protein
MGLQLIIGNWIEVKDGDPRAVVLFERHYSCVNSKADHARYGFSGQGESMILLTQDCNALFGWRKLKHSDDGQIGVNCFVFRNESKLLSSSLILEAERMAWERWAGERLYTYVNSKKILSVHPGYCFLKSGWDYQRDENVKPVKTKGGLYILEKYGLATA